MRTILRLILCTATALSALCSYATPSWRDSLVSQLGYYSRTGRHDSVIAVSHQGIRTALERGDTLAALYSEIFTAPIGRQTGKTLCPLPGLRIR